MRVRAHTESMRRISKVRLKQLHVDYPAGVERPVTRADCSDVPRPCPFTSCRHHLYLDVHPSNGSIKFNFPDIEPDEMLVSCSLDAAGEGAATLEMIAERMNLTRKRMRQLESEALNKIPMWFWMQEIA